ncbi:Phytochrome-like protein cph1 [Roseimaritima multifibrata]|uniref:histidine kinase n=1 Tax=Roseimaritima multifibrata TaxID=1930274 RepID=A0A517MGE4_9BACT|nr:ATP-binding protein [Roseimaritima multifibrata]QDS93936.1 Phytochrome-like protein cph1 [Roseimaritima multifibrata]
MLSSLNTSISAVESARAEELLRDQQQTLHTRTDRVFATLMVFQWVAGIAAAVWLSPHTWTGAMSETHLHVWAAVFLGGAITAAPVLLVWLQPGHVLTRHVVAVGQMLTSGLLIHLSGGRIEAHFHIFGSLAFLACYRDWRVMVTATLVIIGDHWIRGWLWPESVYGVLSGASMRSLEHTGWIVFEDIFLFVTIRHSVLDMSRNASIQARLESINSQIEQEVRRRTEQLSQSVAKTVIASRKLLEANNMLEERNDELDQFTYIASHDLQEPVRKLVSFSQLLEQDIDGELNEDAQRDLGFIVDAAKRMKTLVQALLDFSRIGRSAMQQQSVDLNHCIDDALFALDLRIQETDATITRDEFPIVVGDQMMLTQLYQNLISNALKFIKDKTPQIHLTASCVNDRWVFGVRDNGIGMKKEYTDRIFQPFQRLHGRSEYEGTGIGLSICKKTVQRHEGDIWVESELGAGSHFLFSLQTHQPEPVPVAPVGVGSAALEIAPVSAS